MDHAATVDRPVGRASDRLREALARLREAESRRLEAPYTSAEFFARARDVERHAREVFRLAALEEGPAEQATDPGDPDDPLTWSRLDTADRPRD